jgi:hypothetical protein
MRDQVIQNLKNWSEEAINQTEHNACGVFTDNESMIRELKNLISEAC